MMKKKKTAQHNFLTSFLRRLLLYLSFFPIWGIVFSPLCPLFALLRIPYDKFFNLVVIMRVLRFVAYLWINKRTIRRLNAFRCVSPIGHKLIMNWTAMALL
jgi:membrane protein YqaA with SNARE-associated domain